MLITNTTPQANRAPAKAQAPVAKAKPAGDVYVPADLPPKATPRASAATQAGGQVMPMVLSGVLMACGGAGIYAASAWAGAIGGGIALAFASAGWAAVLGGFAAICYFSKAR